MIPSAVKRVSLSMSPSAWYRIFTLVKCNAKVEITEAPLFSSSSAGDQLFFCNSKSFFSTPTYRWRYSDFIATTILAPLDPTDTDWISSNVASQLIDQRHGVLLNFPVMMVTRTQVAAGFTFWLVYVDGDDGYFSIHRH